MPNNNVAILSIISKFDEKSAREAAKRADKVYEEALSDIGNVNFDKKLLENFDKAMVLLKNKFKKVNLSSYTNNLLDSIFSDKDVVEKSKDIESFIKKINLLKKASSGQDINAFNTFSAKQIEAVISRTEKLAQKQDEINKKTREYNREATKIAKTNRSISTIDKNYGNQDYSKTLESLKKSLEAEKDFTAEQNQSIENLAKMVNLYQIMEKSEPQKGTAEAIRYSKDLLAVTQKIKEEQGKIDSFSQNGASAYITNNGLSSIDKVSEYTVNKAKDDFTKANLSNLKVQEAKLQSELTAYISDSAQKNLAKVQKETDAVIDKAEKRVEGLQNKIDTLQSKSTKTGSVDSVIGNIVSESDVKTLEEIEDRLYAIRDLDADGEATNQQLKEYIQLYKQYEQLISSDSTVKFDPGLKEEYDFIIESDSKLKKYADALDETISKQKELNDTKDNKNASVNSQTEQLVKQEEQIKETVQAEEQLQDVQEKVSSNTKISVDAEQAISDINKVKESLDSIPQEKNIKIRVSDNDYTNTPLLSDAEGNTITAFRGVVGAWSGLVNQDGIGFFTDKLKLAADYADSLAESGKVYQANLSFKNPLEVEGNGAKWDEIDFNGVKKTTDEIVELAKQLGYDGVIFKNIRDGFTDTNEDISNVMVALNAAQIKNEQVIGTVKAGTGEMVDVASKIDNATDTATNSTIESQNKIQEELKETQNVAEQVSEAMSYVSSDKSNISSENPIVESQNKIQEELKETDESIQKILYHYGLLSSYNGGKKSHQFGDEVTAYIEGKSNGGRGWADGTGTYVTNDATEFSKITTTEDFKKFFALDASKLKMYEAHVEEEAKKFYEFQHKLEQFVLALGSGYTGFDDNISDVTSESLYEEAKSVFAKYPEIFNRVFKDFEDFDAFINKTTNLVSESGMNENGFESKNARKLMEFKKNNGIDDIKTRFLKELGFQGTDLSGTSYGGLQSGSVIFDIDTTPIIASGKTIQEVLDTIGVKAEDTRYKVQEVAEVKTDSPIKDVFQGDAEKSGMDEVATATEDAVQAKKDFATATEGIQSSVDDSKSKLELEAELMESIARNAREAANAKKEFIDANKGVEDSAEASSLSLNEEKTKVKEVKEATNDTQTNKFLGQSSKEHQKTADTIKLEDQKRIYKELNDSLDRYATVSKRIASGNALGSDEEEAAKLQERIEELQNEPILSKEQLELSQSKLEKIETTLEDIQKATKETTLDSLQAEIDKFNKDYKSRNTKPSDKNQSNEYKQALEKYKASIDALAAEKDRLSKLDSISEGELSRYKDLKMLVQENADAFKAMSAAQKGSTESSRKKEFDKISKYLKENTRISEEAKQKLEEYLATLKNGGGEVNVEKIHNAFLDVVAVEREAKREGQSFLDVLKDKVWYRWAGQIGAYFGFQDIISYFKQGIESVREYDDGLAKMSYTMDMTKKQFDDLGSSVLNMASDMKTSLDDALSVAQIYANMNTTAEEITRLSEPTLILSNLTGFDAQTVADDIQAVTQQFDILAEDSMHIADVYDYISRSISVDYSKGIESMAEGLQVAGSTAKQAGLSFEQTSAIIAKAVEKTRLEGSQVGNGLKTILTRTSKVGTLSDEVDNETLSQASEALNKINIQVYNLDGTYRKFDVIMGELAAKWDDLSDAEKSNISYALAATRQTNLLSAILSSFSDSMQLAEDATDANGSALENQQKYLDAYSAHLQSLETEAKIAWINILDSDTLKLGIDLLTGLVKVSGKLVSEFGLPETVLTGVAAYAGIKNVGRPKMSGLMF